jgi:hypothetical protein
MAGKYGTVTSSEKSIPADEPVFILRGKDALAPAAIENYAQLLRAAAAGMESLLDATSGWNNLISPSEHLLEMADDCSNVAAEMIAWQSANGARLPD